MTRTQLDLDVLRAERCVAIIRGASVEYFKDTARTLAGAGIAVMEFPLTTPGVLDQLRSTADDVGPGAHIGVGTVTSMEAAKASFNAGAQFLVTPNVNLHVIQYAQDVGLPVLAGAFSSTEIYTAWDAGATAVKLFPGSLGGPGYLRELRSPFPDIPLVPTGGIALAEVPAFLSAGAIAFGMGSALLGDAPAGGSLQELQRRVEQFIDLSGRGAPPSAVPHEPVHDSR